MLASDLGVEVIHDDFAEELQPHNGRVKAVRTLAGREIPADMVGYGIGNDPNISMLEGSGVETNHGVVTDGFLQTNLSQVFAAGDVAEFFDIVIDSHNLMGTWDNAMSQGRLVAKNMLGAREVYFEVPTYVTTMFGSRLSVLGITPDVIGGLEGLARYESRLVTTASCSFTKIAWLVP